MKITIDERDRYSIVRIEGNIVRENQGELRAAAEDLLARKAGGIVLDFALVDYVDSAGLGCCVGIHKLMEARRLGRLVLLHPTANVEQEWRLVRLDLIIPIVDEGEVGPMLGGDPGGPAP